MKQCLEWLLPAYLFLIPWQARYIIAPFSAEIPRYGDWSLYVTDALFLALVVLWFFYLRAERNKPHGDWHSLRLPLAAALVFFVYAFVSLCWTPHVLVGREQLFRLAQAMLTAMMVASGAVSQTRLLIALMVSGAAQGVLAIAQFFSQSIPASTLLGIAGQDPRDLGVSVVEYGDQRWLRAHGSFPHPNILGAFSGLAMLVAAKAYWNIRPKFDHLDIVAWISFILSFCALLFSFSRSAWLATALSLAVLAIGCVMTISRAERKALIVAIVKLGSVAAMLFVFFSALFGPLWINRGHDQSVLGKQSMTDRARLVEQANIISDGYRFKGSGLGSYMPLLTQTYLAQPTYAYQPVHNLWRLLVVEVGYKGVFFALLALLFLAVTIWQQRNLFAASAFVFMLFATWFEHFWYSLPVGLLMLAVVLALPFAKENKT